MQGSTSMRIGWWKQHFSSLAQPPEDQSYDEADAQQVQLDLDTFAELCKGEKTELSFSEEEVK